ncbi:hypothetical protein [Marinilactibacillus kalidii]|uniref:hypothetical protein n=1 Tax=Marinilactibacillus kalidii TaxID=2820274 RepID=UPI001ABDBC2B|nr:hypothetical protein [Marinilactibacillus kalidii]
MADEKLETMIEKEEKSAEPNEEKAVALSETEEKETRRSLNNWNMGFACLIVAILIVLFLPILITPDSTDGYAVYDQFELGINAIRWLTLAVFSFVISLLCLFKK